MKKSIAMKWVDDLIKNKNKQGEGALKVSNNEYCCLGRLCVINGLRSTFTSNSYWYDGEDDQLPYSIIKKTNMKSDLGELPKDKLRNFINKNKSKFPEKDLEKLNSIINFSPNTIISLSMLNDDGISFLAIAEIIKKFYKDL